MAEAVSYRSCSVEAEVQSQAIPYGIFGRLKLGRAFFCVLWYCPASIFPPVARYSFICYQHYMILTAATVSKEHNINVLQLPVFNIFC